MNIRRSAAARRLGLASTLCVALAAACTPAIDTRGNLLSAERLAEIAPGRQTRDEVAHILGTPSTKSAFDDSTWYYISYRTETVAFFSPKEVERHVVAVEFDQRGYVKNISTLGKDDGRDVVFVDRETPSAGKQMTILQQLLGNIGRFEGGGSAGTFGNPLPR